jgi:transketolase
MSNSPIIVEPVKSSCSSLDARSINLRVKLIKMLESSRRGHIISALSLVEILRVLYDNVIQYDPENPKWEQRDRCILSKGHGCMALYVILAEKGFFPEEELWNFCKSDGILGGHPEVKVPGVEASTGSLGHGLSIGIGFALNARYEKATYRIFVIIGDGEANEGAIWEAAMCAGKHSLSNLTVVIDYNKQQSYGSTFRVLNLEPFAEKWRSFGFGVTEVDGHNIDDLKTVFSGLPLESNKPNAIICHTIKGKGIECIENKLSWHHKSKVTDEEIHTLFHSLEVD